MASFQNTRKSMTKEHTTNQDFQKVIARCRSLFKRKLADYGPSWLLFRPTSITDQILIKALRIRSLEQKKDHSLVPESRDLEYVGVINYCIVALMGFWFRDRLPSVADIFNKKTADTLGVEEIMAC